MIWKLVILFLLQKTSCDKVVSAENKNHQERTDRYTANVDTYRRFNEDMGDEEWHVSHLKDPDFIQRSECAEETFEEKAKKYRKSLRNDGALVEYVFAKALPYNTSDLLQSNVCKAPNITDLFRAKANSEPKNITTRASSQQPQLSQKVNDARKANETATEQVNTATTTTPFKDKKLKNVTTDNSKRRASEYLFSSVEYYEDITDFDVHTCPNVVEVIELEQDLLRNYDVECELIVEWRSLDN